MFAENKGVKRSRSSSFPLLFPCCLYLWSACCRFAPQFNVGRVYEPSSSISPYPLKQLSRSQNHSASELINFTFCLKKRGGEDLQFNCLKKEGWRCALLFSEAALAIPFRRGAEPSRNGEEEGLCGVNDQRACVTPEQSWSWAPFRPFLAMLVTPWNVTFNPSKLPRKARQRFFSTSAALSAGLAVWFFFLLLIFCYHSRGMVLIWSNSSLSHNWCRISMKSWGGNYLSFCLTNRIHFESTEAEKSNENAAWWQ